MLSLDMLTTPPKTPSCPVKVFVPLIISVPEFSFLKIAEPPEITPFKVKVVPAATSNALLEPTPPLKSIFLLVLILAVVYKVPPLKLIELAVLPRLALLEILKFPFKIIGDPLKVLLAVSTIVPVVLAIVSWPVPDITLFIVNVSKFDELKVPPLAPKTILLLAPKTTPLAFESRAPPFKMIEFEVFPNDPSLDIRKTPSLTFIVPVNVLLLPLK